MGSASPDSLAASTAADVRRSAERIRRTLEALEAHAEQLVAHGRRAIEIAAAARPSMPQVVREVLVAAGRPLTSREVHACALRVVPGATHKAVMVALGRVRVAGHVEAAEDADGLLRHRVTPALAAVEREVLRELVRGSDFAGVLAAVRGSDPGMVVRLGARLRQGCLALLEGVPGEGDPIGRAVRFYAMPRPGGSRTPAQAEGRAAEAWGYERVVEEAMSRAGRVRKGVDVDHEAQD